MVSNSGTSDADGLLGSLIRVEAWRPRATAISASAMFSDSVPSEDGKVISCGSNSKPAPASLDCT